LFSLIVASAFIAVIAGKAIAKPPPTVVVGVSSCRAVHLIPSNDALTSSSIVRLDQRAFSSRFATSRRIQMLAFKYLRNTPLTLEKLYLRSPLRSVLVWEHVRRRC
jgi:hypothetical protein